MSLRVVCKPFEALTVGELHEAYRLRCAVFVCEQGITGVPEIDDEDPGAVFVLAYEGDRLVGTARVVSGESGVMRIGRVCVVADRRGCGVGRDLMEAATGAALEMAGDGGLELFAQAHLENWYAGQGWMRVGEVFWEAGIEHLRMRRSGHGCV